MRRSAGVGLFLIFLLGLGLSGCGGKGSSATATADPAAITLSPASISLEKGAVLQVTVAVKDKDGNTIFNQTPTFASSNTAEVTVSNGGLLCAGAWDSLTTPIVCTPAAANGTSNLTATAGSVTSNPVVVSVHDHVDNITLAAVPLPAGCKSQTQTQIYQATAFSGGVDVTAFVGAFTWSVTDTGVATVTNTGPSTSPALNANQALLTAVNSGQTNVAASISGTNSLPATFTTCSPHTISIHVQSAADTSFSIATAATKQLAADVVDTAGVTITGLKLLWNTSQPAVATVNSSGLVTGVAPGVSVITASCTPPGCNAGINQAVYSNPVTATITGTATTTTVYATTTDPVLAAGGHRDLIPISTGTNTAGTAIALPADAIINSLLIAPSGSTAYLGSSKGLVKVDLATNAVTSTVSNALGKALAISPNGQFVVTSDTGAGKVYVYDSENNQVSVLNIAGATHASFTTDSLKGYIVAGSTLYQYSIVLAQRTIPMSVAANDVAVNRTGQFAYTAGGELNSVVDRVTCLNDSTWAPAAGDIVGTGATPDLIASASTGDLLAVEGASSEIDKITPTLGAPPAGTSCPPSLSNALATANFSVGAFTPRQIIVTPDGSKAYITSDQTALLGYNVAANTAFTVAVGADTFTGGALIDSSKVYVGGSDKAVHVIDVATGTQSASVSLSFVPDLVAVRPH